VVGVAVTIPITASMVFGQRATYTGSVQFASGNYIFSERTNSLYFYNGFSVYTGPLQISANIPVIIQQTPGVSYSDTGEITYIGTQNSEVKRRGHGERLLLPDTTHSQEVGMGDLVLRLDLQLLEEKKVLPSMSFIGSFKAPIADVDQGFGTGEADYGAGISLNKVFSRNLVLAEMIYWVLGDPPELELKNLVDYIVAIGRPIANNKLSIFVSFSGSSEIVNDVEPPSQVGVGLGYQFSSGSNLNGSISIGVTDSAPDFSVSFGWGIGL
jgi:hypothetical protein